MEIRLTEQSQNGFIRIRRLPQVRQFTSDLVQTIHNGV
jgi:hypothetical protein